MAITPLPTPPLRSDPLNFAARGDDFLGALPKFQVEANALAAAMNLNSTTDSSTSSITIGTGDKTFVVSSGKSFQPGMYLVIADVAAPSTNSLFGQITSYSGTSLVMSIISVRGSGTKSSWVISQSSAGGAQAGPLASSGITGAARAGPLASSGITGAAASGANTDITSITGNAATATAAKSGYFTVANATPKLEINKPGVIAGMWTINSDGNFSFTTTDGTGTVFSELLTITPNGVLSSAGGFNGNAATATTAGNASYNGFLTAGTGPSGTNNTIGVNCSGYDPAYLYSSAYGWGLSSASGGTIIEYIRGTGKTQMYGNATSANNLNGTNHNVQGSRVENTNYSNSSGKTMIVTIAVGYIAANIATLFVDSSPVCTTQSGLLTAVVPNGSFYSLVNTSGIYTWCEYY